MHTNKSMCGLSVFSAAVLAGLTSVSVAYGAATPVQEMSRTVENLCPSLKNSYTVNPASLTPAEQDVLLRCGELKLAAGQSFANLTEAQRNGLGNMTSEESSVMGAATVALAGAQNTAVLGRLSSLRTKTASSVAAGGFAPAKPQTALPSPENETVRQQDGTSSHEGGSVVVNPLQIENGYAGGFSQMSEFGKWGVFFNGSFGSGNKDASLREPGFDFDSWSLVSGLDYRLTDQLVLGVALSYGATESTIDSNGGDVDLDGFGGALYGTYYRDDFYVDFLAGMNGKEYDTRRRVSYTVASKSGGQTLVDQVFNGDTDSVDATVSLGAGYNMAVSGFTITPFAHLAYLESTIDGYTEDLEGGNSNAGFGLALRVDEQEVKSLTSTLGVQLAYAVNTSFGVMTPYLRGDWEHEFENDARNITAHFAAVDNRYESLNTISIPTDEPDRDFANLGGGLVAVLPGGWQCFVDYSTVLGYEDLTLHSFVVGMRAEF